MTEEAVTAAAPGTAQPSAARARLELIVVGEKSLGRTADQDLSVAASQQRALRSAGFRPFYLSRQERRVQRFHEVLDDYLGSG